MSRSAHHWKLGLFVALAAAAGFAAMLWLASERVLPGGGGAVSAVSYFDESVVGLDKGSAVRFRGIKIGRVTELAIAPDGRRVAVRMDLDATAIARIGTRSNGGLDQAVAQGLRVRLTTQGLTGLKLVQAELRDPSRDPAPPLGFQPDPNYVPPVRSTFEQLEETVLDARQRLPGSWDRIDGVLERTERVLERLGVELDALHQARVPDKLAALLDESRAGISDARAPLARALDSLERASDAIARQASAAKLPETAASARDATDAIGELARRSTPLADDLRDTVVELREAAARVRELAELLQRDPGALVHGKTPSEEKR